MKDLIKELCGWLRASSSENYHPTACAADLIEQQAAEIERLESANEEIISTLKYIVENVNEGFVNDAASAADDAITDYG